MCGFRRDRLGVLRAARGHEERVSGSCLQPTVSPRRIEHWTASRLGRRVVRRPQRVEASALRAAAVGVSREPSERPGAGPGPGSSGEAGAGTRARGAPQGAEWGLSSARRLSLGASAPRQMGLTVAPQGYTLGHRVPLVGWVAVCEPQPDHPRSTQTTPLTAAGAPVSDRPFTRTGLLGFVGPVSSPTPGPTPPGQCSAPNVTLPPARQRSLYELRPQLHAHLQPRRPGPHPSPPACGTPPSHGRPGRGPGFHCPQPLVAGPAAWPAS